MHLGAVDWGVICLYLVFVLGIGIVLGPARHERRTDFFLALPRWSPPGSAGSAFISANLGGAGGDRHGRVGRQVRHLDRALLLIGAIPAMVFIGVFKDRRFYYGSKARSAPEYLRMRFDAKTCALNALTFAAMTILELRDLDVCAEG